MHLALVLRCMVATVAVKPLSNVVQQDYAGIRIALIGLAPVRTISGLP